MIIQGAGRTDAVRERADVVVVGTGSGGATLAVYLAERGWDVVMIEKGGFYRAVMAASTAPKKAIGKPHKDLLAKGKPAEFTIFDVEAANLDVRDSQGARSTLTKIFEPRWAILGAQAVAAHRHQPATGGGSACPHCGQVS